MIKYCFCVFWGVAAFVLSAATTVVKVTNFGAKGDDGAPFAAEPLDYVDTLIGTEGTGTQYGGMMPMTGVPFGSMQAVAMTRTNAIGRLSFNAADDTLLGVILTRQPSIWMGDWGEVRIPMAPAKIESFLSKPYLTQVTAGGTTVEFTATSRAAWIRFSKEGCDFLGGSGFCTNRMDAVYGYPLPNFRGWYFVDRPDAKNLRIGVSLISLEQARENLRREMPDGESFESVTARVKETWREQLARITIEADDNVKTIFYTGVYHASLYPREIDECGRYYSAFDDKIHRGKMYSCYSLWDTYRAEHSLLTLMNPERVDAMMQSLLEMYREGGWLPKWPNPSYTGIMIGGPAEVVLAEAYVKGFRGFDVDLAYEAVRKNAMVPQTNDRDFTWRDRGTFGRTPETRGGLTRYMELGYVACDETRESVSRTQDFCLDDCAAAVLAEATGHSDEAAMFRRRAKNYTNLWNSAAGEFHPRRSDGVFGDPTDKRNYCEQSCHTAVWAIPFDTEGLVGLLGGDNVAVRRLDDFFDRLFWVPERGSKSIHGNEPSH